MRERMFNTCLMKGHSGPSSKTILTHWRKLTIVNSLFLSLLLLGRQRPTWSAHSSLLCSLLSSQARRCESADTADSKRATRLCEWQFCYGWTSRYRFKFGDAKFLLGSVDVNIFVRRKIRWRISWWRSESTENRRWIYLLFSHLDFTDLCHLDFTSICTDKFELYGVHV